MGGRPFLITLALVSGCWYGTQPTTPSRSEPAVPSSYRAATIIVDAVGVSAMALGAYGMQRGYNEDVSGALLVTGLTAAGYVTPIIHLAKGNRARAGGSFLIRSIGASTGTVIGSMAGCPREPSDEWFCGLTGMMWGIAGGLAVSSAIDAIYFHDEEGAPRSWTPTVTTGDGQARVGIAGSF